MRPTSVRSSPRYWVRSRQSDVNGDGLINQTVVAPVVGVVRGGPANPEVLCAADAYLVVIVIGLVVASFTDCVLAAGCP